MGGAESVRLGGPKSGFLGSGDWVLEGGAELSDPASSNLTPPLVPGKEARDVVARRWLTCLSA